LFVKVSSHSRKSRTQTHGTIVVFGFGHDEISDVLFVGLNGFNVEKHVQGWHVVHIFLLWCGLKLCGRGSPFSTWTSLTFPLSLLFLRLWGSLNKTSMSLAVHVLMARRTIHVVAPMSFKGLGSHFFLSAGGASTAMKTDGGLRTGGRFARVVLDEMRLETSVSKKVPMTLLATSCGFETSWVSMKEIGAIFLATGPAMAFVVASMTSLGVIGFPTVSTYITRPEKSRQTGNDIVMTLVVQQDQLFVSKGSKGCYMIRPVGIHQDDLVMVQGRGGTEGRQGIVAARTQGHLGFMLELQSQGSLKFPSFSNRFPFRMLVQASFGDHEGSGTTELIFIVNSDDRFRIPC